MSKKTQTWKTAIYKIQDIVAKEIIELSKNEEKIDCLKNLLQNGYESKPIKSSIADQYSNYQFFCFYCTKERKAQIWQNFFDQVCELGDTKQQSQESGIIFIYSNDTKRLYAICGGFGSLHIQHLAESHFGMDVLERIIDTESSSIIQEAREVSVTNSILSVSKIFRNNFSFNENESFGSIYRQLKISDSNAIDKLFSQEKREQVPSLIISSSLKINKSLTLDEFILLIQNLDTLLNKEIKHCINNMRRLDIRKDSEQIKKLLDKLEEKLIEASQNKDFSNFAILPQDDYNNLEIASYKIKGKKIDNREEILEKLNPKDINKDLEIKIYYDNSEDSKPRTTKLFKSLIAEVSQNDQKIFYFFGDWIILQSDFVETLNAKCKTFIQNNKNNNLIINWKKDQTEEDYNLEYRAKEWKEKNFYVLDKILIENIEVCDILEIKGNTTYLYHVKQGFDGSMRVLSRQVEISAKRLHEARSADSNFFCEFYEKVIDKYDNLEKESFIKSLKENKIVYVMAIVDKGKNRTLEEIEKYDSTIAKFCLQDTSQYLKGLDFKLEIAQINKELSND